MTQKKPMRRRAILAFVLNRPGVLNKISMLIRRKMYNVDTITACETKRPDISRITLTLREDRDDKIRKVLLQMEKLTEVISARELDTTQSFWREVAVVKFEASDTQLEKLRSEFRFKVLDRKDPEVIIVQIAGTIQMIDDFLAAVGHDKVIEAARSGCTALEK
ncbi:MAG: acetolactate synthase small subunit [Desulfobacterales bacterium]